MSFTVNSVELPTGIRLPYVEQGHPLGVPVLLLHGITDSWHSFERVLPHLPDSIRAFALSQRGHGDADRPTTGYSPQDFAADLSAALTRNGQEALTAAIAGSRLVVYPGAGHGLHWEEPARFAADLTAFVESVE